MSLRSGIGLWCALAVFLLVQAALSWTARDQIARQLVEQRVAAPEDATSDAQSILLTNLGIAAALAIVYAGLALLLLKRWSWARIALTVVAVVHVLVVLGRGAPSAPGLIALAMAGAALMCCWLRQSSEWLNGEY